MIVSMMPANVALTGNRAVLPCIRSAASSGSLAGHACPAQMGRIICRASSNNTRNGAQQPVLRPSDLLDSDGPARPSTLLDSDSAVISSGAGGGPCAVPGSGGYWQELLCSPEDETLDQHRARSASDASALRRKGHLKEQDKFIEFILAMHQTHTCAEVMMKMDRWIKEHKQDPRKSKLAQLVPTIGGFFTELNLTQAFLEYDEFFAISRRKYIGPNFAEIRHILNIAQVHGSASDLKLITFDADGTLYADGHHFDTDNAMIDHIITLMRSGIEVAIVTAAGYPGQPEKFEMRIQGLLDKFKSLMLPERITNKFHILGGECNYLVRVVPGTYRLEMVPDSEWKSEEMMEWKEEDIQALLDDAENLIREGAARLRLPVKMLRKERAVGALPAQPTIYEVLEDLAINVHTNLIGSKVPYCAFNGGNDVFVDVGNKSLGLNALQQYYGAAPHEVMHVGDRFTDSGNDTATREKCSILWVANPEETAFFMKLLLADIRTNRRQLYVE